jgi:probable phosphoglycerate mutase
MKRALQTCEFARVSAQPFIDADAREWDYGAYEGLTSQEIHQLDSSWTIFSKGAPQGESIEQITQRADRLLHKLLLYRGIVLLISHGHFSRVLAARWLNLEAGMGRCFMLSVASLSILGYEREDRAIQLWNDTSFLGSS